MTRQFNVQFGQPLLEVQAHTLRGPVQVIAQTSGVDYHRLLLDAEQANCRLLQSIQEQLSRLTQRLQAYQNEVTTLALQFAESFTAQIFQADQDLANEKVCRHVRDCLSAMVPSADVVVWVHPDRLDTIGRYCRSFASAAIQVKPDPLLPDGDCRVEGPDSGLIARMDHQLDVCRQQYFTKMGLDQP